MTEKPDQVAALTVRYAALRRAAGSRSADPGGMPPAEFAAFIKTETVKWAKVVKESGATVE